jgi:opacity protein-like surface antigen
VHFGRLAGLSLAASPLLAVAQAQSITSPPPRIGIVAGVNSATVGGKDADNPNRRTGYMAGVMLIAPMGTSFAFQPELLYTQKGARVNDSDFVGGVKISYLEVPLLLRADMMTSSAARPFLYAGPAIAFKTGCEFELVSGATSANTACDQSGDPADFKSTDVSVLVGGGLAFNLSGQTVSVGLRYDHGLKTFSGSNDVKHRVVSLVGTIEFPWGR